MKKLIAIGLLALTMVGFASCGGDDWHPEQTTFNPNGIILHEEILTEEKIYEEKIYGWSNVTGWDDVD